MSTGSRLAMSEGMAWTSGLAAKATWLTPIAEASVASPSSRAIERRCTGMVGSSWLIRAIDDDGTGNGMLMADIDQRWLGQRTGGLRQRASSGQATGGRRIDS